MALAILYESGLPSMADYEDTYSNELIKDFYKEIPSKRDDMVFLCGELDGYYCAAVQSGDAWYVAGINSSDKSRTITLDLSFLGEGSYEAKIYNDPQHNFICDIYCTCPIINTSTQSIQSGSDLDMKMEASGGFVIVIK